MLGTRSLWIVFPVFIVMYFIAYNYFYDFCQLSDCVVNIKVTV